MCKSSPCQGNTTNVYYQSAPTGSLSSVLLMSDLHVTEHLTSVPQYLRGKCVILESCVQQLKTEEAQFPTKGVRWKYEANSIKPLGLK